MRTVRGGSRHDYPVYKLMDPGNRYLENPVRSGTEGHVGSGENRPELMIQADLTAVGSGSKVLFLIRDISKWEYFDELYSREKELGNDVAVAALPFRYKDEMGRPTGDVITDDINLTNAILPESDFVNASSYDIKDEISDRVYIQDPFDAYSLATEVDSAFFADNIRPYTKELIFVFPYDIKVVGRDDAMQKEMLRQYMSTPGVRLADKILVRDERVKDFFETFFI